MNSNCVKRARQWCSQCVREVTVSAITSLCLKTTQTHVSGKFRSKALRSRFHVKELEGCQLFQTVTRNRLPQCYNMSFCFILVRVLFRFLEYFILMQLLSLFSGLIHLFMEYGNHVWGDSPFTTYTLLHLRH